MRPVRGILAGITLVIVLAALIGATSPTSAQTLPTETPVPVELPAELPDLQGVPDLPVDVPGIGGLSGILACITGATSDLSSPSGLTGPLQCIIEQLLVLVKSLLGGLGSPLGELPVEAPALP